jgi:hypothetical protein
VTVAPHLQILIDRGVITVDSKTGAVRLTREAWLRSTDGTIYAERTMLHFVGFKDDRYNNAVKTFGKPDFIHRHWDVRATHEVMPGDVVIFAKGNEQTPPTPFAFDDSANF